MSQKTPRILLANLFPRGRAAVAPLDSPWSWAFNEGICEAPFAAFWGSPTVSVRFMRQSSAYRG